jgi:hypothetical protein
LALCIHSRAASAASSLRPGLMVKSSLTKQS